MIFVAGQSFSQNLRLKMTPASPTAGLSNAVPASLLRNENTSLKSVAAPFLSGNYYASKLGFFCKQEIKFEKIVKVPFKFRLGGVEDCDKLEGKRNWRN